MEKISNYLILLENIIKESTNGHLPLGYRVQLMQKINSSSLVNKIFYNCALKVMEQNSDIFSDNDIFNNILLSARDFLYNNKGKREDFDQTFDKNENYLNEFGNIGWLLLSLCNNIASEASLILYKEDYKDYDDNHYDFEEWNTDFWAAIIYSGGNPFIDKKVDDIKKRKEFWLWYVGMVEGVCKNPNIEIIPFTYQKKENEITSIPFRNQLQLNDKYRTLFGKVIALIFSQVSVEIKWEYIKIQFISCGGSILNVYYSNEERIKLSTNSFYEICNTFMDIRENMYRKYPKEGAWFQIELLINRDKSYVYDFNYDNYDKIPEVFQDPDSILELSENFPRSKEYTPHWLQRIIGKKVKYLK